MELRIANLLWPRVAAVCRRYLYNPLKRCRGCRLAARTGKERERTIIKTTGRRRILPPKKFHRAGSRSSRVESKGIEPRIEQQAGFRRIWTMQEIESINTGYAALLNIGDSPHPMSLTKERIANSCRQIPLSYESTAVLVPRLSTGT